MRYLLLLALFALPQQCTYDSACRTGECAVIDINGGQKCVPKTRPVMVYDGQCIRAIELGKNTVFEAPMKDGEPDFPNAVLRNAVVKLGDACGRIEYREN